jgi:hypothetical protein
MLIEVNSVNALVIVITVRALDMLHESSTVSQRRL